MFGFVSVVAFQRYSHRFPAAAGDTHLGRGQYKNYNDRHKVDENVYRHIPDSVKNYRQEKHSSGFALTDTVKDH